jgi:hypothetical protein
MSRCVQFWHKFEVEGNFCGMDPSEISRVKAYLEFVGKLEKVGLEKDFIFQHFTVGAARPLISTSDEETRTKALDYVAHCLKRKETVTAGDLKGTINIFLKESGKACSVNARSEKLENSKIRAQPAPESVNGAQSEKPIMPVNLGDSIRKQEMEQAAANQPEHGRARDPTNPEMPATHTHQEPAFKTGNEIRQGLMAPEREPKPEDPEKVKRREFLADCERAYDNGSKAFQMAIDDHMRYHPSWRCPGDVIFFCVTDPKEALGGVRKP